MTSPDIGKGSEFGGVPGRVQPHPHDVADHPSEQLGLVYATNEDGVIVGAGHIPDDKDPAVPQLPQVRR